MWASRLNNLISVQITCNIQQLISHLIWQYNYSNNDAGAPSLQSEEIRTFLMGWEAIALKYCTAHRTSKATFSIQKQK